MVKWVAKNSEVLNQAIDETSTTKNVQLGTVVRCWDSSSDALGEADFMYATGVASTVLGDLCEIENAGASTVRAVASGHYRQLGVAMSANVAGPNYGWYQITGKAKILALASFLANADCYLTSTAGSIDDADVSGDYIYGMKGITAVDTPATGFAYVQMAGGCFTTNGDQILDEDNTWTGAQTWAVSNTYGSTVITETDLAKIDGITNGTQAAGKAVVADANINTGISKVTQLHIGSTGAEVQLNATPAELNTKELFVTMADVSTASSVWIPCPVAGTISKIYTIINGAIATADALITAEINTVAVTDSTVTIATSGSAAGDVDSSTPSAANTVAVGDKIELITNGASTNTVIATICVVITL